MYTDDFTAWWTAYPRKVAKRKSLLSWQIAVKEIAQDRGICRQAAIEWLLERTRLFAKSDKGRSGEFCPYPTTWLFQGRYDDDIDEWYDRRTSMPTQEDIESWRA